jgi:hypothetical protein
LVSELGSVDQERPTMAKKKKKKRRRKKRRKRKRRRKEEKKRVVEKNMVSLDVCFKES